MFISHCSICLYGVGNSSESVGLHIKRLSWTPMENHFCLILSKSHLFIMNNLYSKCRCFFLLLVYLLSLFESFQTVGLIVSCLLGQFVHGSWVPGAVSPSWLVSWPRTSWWIVRNLRSFEWHSFVTLVWLEEGHPFPRNVEGWGEEEEEGTTWTLMKREHQDPELTQTEQLRIPSGCLRSLLLICSLDLVLVLVKGCLCGDRGGQEGLFSPFSVGSARNSRLRLIGAVKISVPPECKGRRRLIPQSTITRNFVLSSWESIMLLSLSTHSGTWTVPQLLYSCTFGSRYCVCVAANLEQTHKNLFFLTRRSLWTVTPARFLMSVSFSSDCTIMTSEGKFYVRKSF